MAEEKTENKTGEIWVTKFTEDSASKFREEVLNIALRDSTFPIIIYIDSYGGGVDALAKMIATIDQVENPIITCCLGKAMSCGAILLSHGAHRYCDPHSRILVHEISTGSIGNVHDVNNDANESKRLNEYWMGILADNCGIKGGFKTLRTKIKNHDGTDLHLTPESALEFGIIDEIGTPQIVPRIAYELFTIESSQRKEKILRAVTILGLK